VTTTRDLDLVAFRFDCPVVVDLPLNLRVFAVGRLSSPCRCCAARRSSHPRSGDRAPTIHRRATLAFATNVPLLSIPRPSDLRPSRSSTSASPCSRARVRSERPRCRPGIDRAGHAGFQDSLAEPVIDPPVHDNDPATSSSPAPVRVPPLNVSDSTLDASVALASSSEPPEILERPFVFQQSRLIRAFRDVDRHTGPECRPRRSSSARFRSTSSGCLPQPVARIARPGVRAVGVGRGRRGQGRQPHHRARQTHRRQPPATHHDQPPFERRIVPQHRCGYLESHPTQTKTGMSRDLEQFWTFDVEGSEAPPRPLTGSSWRTGIAGGRQAALESCGGC